MTLLKLGKNQQKGRENVNTTDLALTYMLNASRPNWLVASRRSKHGIEAIRGDRRPPHWPSGGHTAATKPHCVNSWQLSGDVIYSRKLGS